MHIPVPASSLTQASPPSCMCQSGRLNKDHLSTHTEHKHMKNSQCSVPAMRLLACTMDTHTIVDEQTENIDIHCSTPMDSTYIVKHQMTDPHPVCARAADSIRTTPTHTHTQTRKELAMSQSVLYALAMCAVQRSPTNKHEQTRK